MYRDFRELLDRNDIDAVLIATGPNWHATAAMAAARAGKDMYCEKPCTKNIAQSLILAETMRRTGVVFQAGTQRRNLPHFAFACELARTGKLGKLKRVYAHPVRDDGHDERLAPRGDRAGQGSRRLGHVPRARRPGVPSMRSCSTASISKRGAGCVGGRRAGMGLALRRPLPMGRRKRSARRRSNTTRRKTGRSSTATRTASSWSSARRAGFRSDRVPFGSRAKRDGSKRATAARWC